MKAPRPLQFKCGSCGWTEPEITQNGAKCPGCSEFYDLPVPKRGGNSEREGVKVGYQS